jgi:hypothetical protein
MCPSPSFRYYELVLEANAWLSTGTRDEVILPARPHSPFPSPPSPDKESCEIVDNGSLEDVETVPDEVCDDSSFQAEPEQDTELEQASVESDSAVDAVAEPVDDDWGPSTPANSENKSRKKKKKKG